MILYTIERVQLSNFNDSKKIKANPSTLVYQVEVQDQINMQALMNTVRITTVRPRDTRPQDARTLTTHVFE